MSQAEAIAFAHGESPLPTPPPDGPQAGASLGRLTRREQDVAILVARGMSNSQIAATLVISVRTVETHVQHIMDKLGVSTRAQIAAWSTARPPASPAPGHATGGSGRGDHESGPAAAPATPAGGG
jgi:DNA-binding NarL/FixJ family response regulator